MAQLSRALPPARAPARTRTVTLYEETEELGFYVGVGKSNDNSLILVSTGDNATSEVRFVRGGRSVAAADADFAPQALCANIMSTRRTGNCGS